MALRARGTARGRWTLAVVAVFAMATALAAGCGSGIPVKRTDRGVQAPEWADNPPKGCGVGSAGYRGLRDLARKTAVTSAREDLSKAIRVLVQGMVKRYMSAGEAGQDYTEEQQTAVVRDVVDQWLAGTRVVKTEMMSEEMYALVCLDPESFGDAFERMSNLTEKARKALKERAEAEFQELDRQIEKIDSQP